MAHQIASRKAPLLLARSFSISNISRGRVAQRNFSRSSWSSCWKDGTIEFAVGGLMITALAIDQVLQYQERLERNTIMNEIHNATRVGSVDDEAEMEEWLNRQNPLFDCVVRTVPFSLDGYKCLKGIEVGDVVEVLEEKVGPGNMYNLCRRKINRESARPVAAGWVPTKYLEKITA